VCGVRHGLAAPARSAARTQPLRAANPWHTEDIDLLTINEQFGFQFLNRLSERIGAIPIIR
jgi:hypothetical protein